MRGGGGGHMRYERWGEGAYEMRGGGRGAYEVSSKHRWFAL